MRLVKMLVLLGGIAVAFVGCSKGGAAAVKAQEEFATKACACKDIACVKKVQEEQTAWVQQHGQAIAGGSEADAEKIAAANKKLSECIQKIVREAAK